jgi:AcrR family transcriptional regulator
MTLPRFPPLSLSAIPSCVSADDLAVRFPRSLRKPLFCGFPQVQLVGRRRTDRVSFVKGSWKIGLECASDPRLVHTVTTRARVPENAFNEIFATVEECYRAAFEEGLERLSRATAEAAVEEQAWLERVRSGLFALLGFFDDEPCWARLLVLETSLSGTATFDCRRRLHELLAGLLDSGIGAGDCGVRGRVGGSPVLLATLTGELVVGGIFSVIRTSMLEEGASRLVELAPSLMAFVVAPYLGQAAAQAELEGRVAGSGEASRSEPELARAKAISRAAELPIRATHRTTLVLRAIAGAPYSNNREIAQAAGLADEGQASKLLARLERKGVIENVGIGASRGEPNAWLLTPAGRAAVELIGESYARRPRGTRTRGAA